MTPFIVRSTSADPGELVGPAQPQALALVSARPDRFPPPAVLQIPRDRFAQSCVKVLARRPAQLAHHLSGIHSITLVVAGSIDDEGDELLMFSICGSRQHFVE